MTSGNGWVLCRCGHRHWGRFGAAGLLVVHGVGDDLRVLLAHRAAWTHQGGVWAVPGGARDSDETPLQAALRETAEETTLETGDVTPFAEWVDDHGDWRYTTILARVPARSPVAPRVHADSLFPGGRQENDEVRWWRPVEVDGLALHPGFARAWPHLRERADAVPPGHQ